MNRMPLTVAFTALAVACAALTVACTRTIVIQWPSEPLKVVVVGGGGACVQPTSSSDGGMAAAGDAAVDDTPKNQTQKATLGDHPLRLATSGTLVYVETSGGSGSGVTIYEVDASSPADQACESQSRRELWKLRNGGRWDAQQHVDAGKVLCAQTNDYAGGEVSWLVRSN